VRQWGTPALRGGHGSRGLLEVAEELHEGEREHGGLGQERNHMGALDDSAADPHTADMTTPLSTHVRMCYPPSQPEQQCWAVGPDLIEQFILSGGSLCTN